ncbi:MAG: V-type ATPase subunit, partial [Lachnospiraceae bacterium]
LVDNLKDTSYFEPLNRLRQTHASTLFDYNLALDLYYYSSIWKEKNKTLKGQSLEIFTKYHGVKIDFLNLQWIYRAKKYYHMTSTDIYSLLIPIHYKIRTPMLRALVESASIDEFNVLLYQTYYCKKYNTAEKMSLEAIYSDYLYRLFRTDSKNNPYSITTINNYLFLKEEEIRKITTALECIRYKLGPSDISRYVGGVAQ